MKLTRLIPLALLTLSAAGAASAQTSVSAGIHVGPSGRASVDLGFFYDDLASYGNWIERPSHGWVWTPSQASTSWRPYQNGHWVWTDEGWTWVTDEPYGWATYHYGRWYDDPDIGWSWVPGQDWAPAWVSWQEGTNYVGWAALPPDVNYSSGGGYGSYAYGIAPTNYVFVEERNFLAPRIVDYVVPQTQVVTVFRDTRNITSYRSVNNRIFNQGVQVDRIQRVVGRPVPRYQLADLGASSGGRRAEIQGNRVAFFRPQVQKTANIQPPPARPAARKAVVDANQFRASHPDRANHAARASAAPASAPQASPGRAHQAQQRAQRQQQAQGRQQGHDQTPPATDQPKAQPQRQARQPRQPQPAPADQQPPAQKRQRPQAQAREQQQPPPVRRQRQPRTQTPDSPQQQAAPQPQRQQRQRPPQAEPQQQRQRAPQAEPQQQRQRPPQAEPQQRQRPPQAAPQGQPENQKKRREPPPPPPPQR